jgi:hypothetical protein
MLKELGNFALWSFTTVGIDGDTVGIALKSAGGYFDC